MKQHFIQQSGSDKLILLFAGWGMDNHPFASLEQLPCDCMLCYDYTHLDFDSTLLSPYKEIELYAWSMGVWVAATLLSQMELPIVQSTAINGTHYPIDGERGIAPPIFEATLAAVSEVGLRKFYRRMCDNRKELLAQFTPPQRDPEALRLELLSLQQQVLQHDAPSYAWGNILIGEGDRIFPSQNQCCAWQGCNYHLTTDAHFVDFKALME